MERLEKIWKRGKEFLGTKYPILSGGMTWISDYDLVKAVGDNGAFPVLAAGNMPVDLLEKEIDKCLDGLKTPFAVNLITIAPNYRQHYEMILKKDVKFVVFAGSFPTKDDVVRMKKAGKKTMSFASTESIAKRQIEWGVDALILEGSEAGGHIGYVSLVILLQQVLLKFRDFPIFVAGGIATGEMMAHLLMMGACGVQFGTRFVVSEECTAHPEFKRAFIRAKARQAIATPQYDSKLPVVAVRALKNNAMDKFGELQLELLNKMKNNQLSKEEAQFQVEHYWVGSLRTGVIDGDVQNGSLMAGQSVGLVKKIQPIKEIIEELVNDCSNEIERTAEILK
ncbi:MAG: nitronate monooxygenase [Candidatus Delongbacteria bacterium]|nr:nitronate monooxygenase [Candidatus Delongbacteria bacterium]MBN2833650.1 nitronate monooxygenase [Candidatus Delongbacteria bacterium]